MLQIGVSAVLRRGMPPETQGARPAACDGARCEVPGCSLPRAVLALYNRITFISKCRTILFGYRPNYQAAFLNFTSYP